MDTLDPGTFPAGIVRLDADDRIVDANAWFVEWSGRGLDKLVGTPLSGLLRPVREDLLRPGDGDGPFMMRHLERLGSAVLVARAAHGDGALLTVLDATERYRALRELRRSHALADRTQARLQLVIDASIAFGDATTEERLAEILADTTARAYGAEQSGVLLLDGRELQLAAGSNPLAAFVDMAAAARFAEGLEDVIKVSGVAEAESLSPNLAVSMRATGIEALLIAPLRHEDVTAGLFACFFEHPRTFDQEAAPLADALAGQAAQALVGLRLQSRLAHAAMHDETTGLPNRRLLEERMRELEIGERHRRAVIFLDLDGFKTINDALGHQVGDEVLREVGRRLQATVREGDIVARYGGDEFVVVCSVDDRSDAGMIAERLRESVREPVPFLPPDIPLGASVGVALAPVGDDRLALDRVIRAADRAMYTAKSRGGDLVVDDVAAESLR